MNGIKPRWFARNLQAALRVLPVVVVTGARQTGKTTLVQSLAAARAFYALVFKDALKRKATLIRNVVFHAGKACPLGTDVLALPWGWMVPRTK